MASDDDRGGYKRPPKHAQFQKGHSGNPRGRPRRAAKTLTSDLREELAESVRVRDGDREYQITKQRAVLKALIAAAAQGNVSAATALFSLQARLVKAAADDPSESSVSNTDQAILDDFVDREIARRELSMESRRTKSSGNKGGPVDDY